MEGAQAAEQERNSDNRRNIIICSQPELTCGCNAVESDKGVEAGSGSRQDACEAKRHEAAYS